MYRKYIKRMLDFVLSLIAIVVLSPIFLIVGIAIKINDDGPIFFRQMRVGKENRQFEIFKFRTMKMNAPKNCPTHLLDNPNQWITSIGKFLRKTSLDELPQIWNILKGNMSIVGPRPSLPNQKDLNHLRDLNGASQIRPGLTGLAQISGRDELEIELKAALDGKYASNITFVNDLKIFLKTFVAVFKSEGVKEGK